MQATTHPDALERLDTLVDHRSVFNADGVQLCLYDTYEHSDGVPFKADEIMFCAMIQGRKVMHHPSLEQGQDFIPGQSFVIAPQEHVAIDFPDATLSTPTRCLTIEIDTQKLHRVARQMRLHSDSDAPAQTATLQLNHSASTEGVYRRLIEAFSENEKDRGLLIELASTELLVRLLREQEHKQLLSCAQQDPQATLWHAVVTHIEHNLGNLIDVDTLCSLACMCRSKFFSAFRHRFGLSPQAYILKRRLERAQLLLNQGKSVTNACFETGFNSVSHFSRSFKGHFGVSPRGYCQQGMN
ncbi:helix-turn-helix transcriptional regulator [Pseudoalteromonas sp. T1lg48]|uniref:helix-turn-helix transcriptional regulator n=1 Tax=Pseudoalteromonas sp. T1lg48 TaxID=2077100 RepID=UPI001319EB56|nr:AraC family transcriptional regulator [Pseudoalteromonas sp. T1lg48]